MSEPFLGEIKIFGFNFPPRSWALCDGQILPINQNQALYSLLGTTYGGDGRTSFGLPDLRGRAPWHVGGGFSLGQKGGEETHSVSPGEMPTHTHTVAASSLPATTPDPENAVWANGGVNAYAAEASADLSPAAVASVGDGQGHENRPPYLTVSFCIALQGIFPSRN
jgi:microcystin-dependent protein